MNILKRVTKYYQNSVINQLHKYYITRCVFFIKFH